MLKQKLSKTMRAAIDCQRGPSHSVGHGQRREAGDTCHGSTRLTGKPEVIFGSAICAITVAVGTTIADRPPRRSVRARLRIRLLPWMNGGEACCWPHTVQSLGHALPALCRTHV
jgi:hypothetical protein